MSRNIRSQLNCRQNSGGRPPRSRLCSSLGRHVEIKTPITCRGKSQRWRIFSVCHPPRSPMTQYGVHVWTVEHCWFQFDFKNIAKGTTDPRVEFISQVQTQILIKFHLQNLDQASTSKSQPNISLSITPAKKTGQASTSNLAWTSTSKSWPNISLSIKLELQNLKQT